MIRTLGNFAKFRQFISQKSYFFSFHRYNNPIRRLSQYSIANVINTIPNQIPMISLMQGQQTMFKSAPPKRIYKAPVREDFLRKIDFAQEIKSNDIKNFKTNLVGGNVVILAGPPGVASVKISWDANLSKELLPKFYLDRDTLFLTADSFKPFLTQKNAFVFEITLPATVNVDVQMYGGTVFVNKMAGNFKVNMWAGSVTGFCSSKALDVTVHAGEVTVYNLCGNAKASVSFGDIQLLFDKLEKNNTIALYSKFGDVNLRLPAGTLETNQVIKNKKNLPNLVGANITTSTFLGDTKVDMQDSSPLVNSAFEESKRPSKF